MASHARVDDLQQVFLVIIFWLWRIGRGGSGPPGILCLQRINKALSESARFRIRPLSNNLPLERFTPWQVILSTLTAVYTLRNFDTILGLSGALLVLLICATQLNRNLQAPEPLAHLVS